MTIYSLLDNTDLLGSRHVFAFMGFLGLASIYMMRINLSVAIVDMVKTESMNATSFFSRGGDEPGNFTEGQCEDQGSDDDQVANNTKTIAESFKK